MAFKTLQASGDWRTCACGQLSVIIPRGETGVPVDSRLQALGMDFCCAVVARQFQRALSLLDSIEKRSQELINEIMAALPTEQPLELQPA